MEKLKGPDSISVVTARFNDGCEVVRCVLDFYKGMAEIENTYATSVTKLLKSTSYTFHSNILMQWLGSGPFEELGTVKTGWQKLGTELCKLVEHHSDKGKGYLNLLRQPLSDLLPRLETMRKTVRTRGKDLVTELEQANKKHKAEKQSYMKCGNRYEKMQRKLSRFTGDTSDPKYCKQQDELRILLDAVKHHEALYQNSVYDLAAVQKSFNHELSLLYRSADILELERVNAVGKSLQEFAKILSNTAPSYLECMQKIVFSVSDIDGQKDISSFVDDHQHLMTEMKMLQFEPHPCRGHAYSSGYLAATNVGAGPLTTQDQTTSQDQAASQDQVANQDADVLSEDDGDVVVVATKTTEELLMPVEDHFKNSNGSEAVTQDSAEDDGQEDKPHIIKTLTKKLKFWSWVGRPSDDNTEGQADDQANDSINEGAAKSVDDEIEAILSTPKKKTKKRSRKEPALPEDAATQPKDETSPVTKDDISPVTKDDISSVSATTSQSDEASPFQNDQEKVSSKASSPARSDFNKDPSPPAVKPKPSTSTVKQRVATLDRSSDNPAPSPDQQKGTMLDKGRDRSGPPPVRRKTTALNKTTDNTSSPPVRRKTVSTDRGSDNPVVKQKTTSIEKSSDNLTPPIKMDTASANPSPPLVTQKPTVAVKPKPTAKPQAHIAPLQREEQPTTPELLLRQLEQKAHDNDYYQLLEVDPSADFDEISRQRRERSKELHPDHFMADATQKAKAQEELTLINQVYTDVLSKERSRELYNQLCKFRKFYKQILLQEGARLKNAQERMGGLRDSLRKAKTPLALQEEVDIALKLIQLRLDKSDS